MIWPGGRPSIFEPPKRPKTERERQEEKIGFYLMAGVLGFCALFIICIVHAILFKEICIEEKVVTHIGGCNSHGQCGVRLSNGESKRLDYPVVGDLECVKSRTVPRWP